MIASTQYDALTEQPVTLAMLAQAPVPQEDVARREAMKHAWKAYKGDLPTPLKIAPNQPDDNVLSNRCAPIVDKGVSFLFGNVLKIEATDEATEDGTDSTIQDFIDGLWGDDDDKMTLLSQDGTNGGVCGHAFLKLIPAQGQMLYPRIVVLDPQLVRIVTAPDDCSLVLSYVIEYTSGDIQKRQIIIRNDPDGLAGVVGEYDLDDTWTIYNFIRYARGGPMAAWQQNGKPIEWPYPFAPIFDNQNLPASNEAWGSPDLTADLIGLNKVLNFVQSNTSRIIKYHGHPITYATGLAAEQIQMGVDDLICLPSPDSKLEKLEAMTDFPGLLNFAAVIRADMDEQSRVPAVALGRTAEVPKGNVSGVALQLLFQPLIEKTTIKRRTYGKKIRAITRAALVVAGLISLEQYERYKITMHWGDLLPIDDTQAAQTATLLKSIGVSTKTLLGELGYDADAESEKNDQESERQAQKQPAPPGVQNTQQQTMPMMPGSTMPGQHTQS